MRKSKIVIIIFIAISFSIGVIKYNAYLHIQEVINAPRKPQKKWHPRPMETYGMETANCWINVNIKGNTFRIPKHGGTDVRLPDGSYLFSPECHKLDTPPIKGISFDIFPRSLPGFENVITQILIDTFPDESFKRQRYRFFTNCVERLDYKSVKELPVKDGFYQCMASYVPVDPKFTAPDGSPLVFSHGVIFPWKNIRVRVRLTKQDAVPLHQLKPYYKAILQYIDSLEIKQ